MPTNYVNARVPLKETEPLADLYGVASDLDLSILLCRAAMDMVQSGTSDAIVVDGLVSAGIIRYFRCFATSPRLGLRHEDVDEFGPVARASHNYFRGLRDKYVAHCLNVFEEQWVTAVVPTTDGVPGNVASLGRGGTRVLLHFGEAMNLLRLAEAMLSSVNQKIALEDAAILALVKQIPLEAVHKWDLGTGSSNGPADVLKTRKQTVRRGARDKP